jgi:hypothetical protein
MAAEDNPRGPLHEFLVYCQEERERFRNSDESFDEALFDEAVDLAERKIKMLLGEELA